MYGHGKSRLSHAEKTAYHADSSRSFGCNWHLAGYTSSRDDGDGIIGVNARKISEAVSILRGYRLERRKPQLKYKREAQKFIRRFSVAILKEI